jgi:hypothetical protein
VKGEHGDLPRLAVGAGQLGLPAVVDRDVGGVALPDDLEPFVDLAAQVGIGEVGEENRGPETAWDQRQRRCDRSRMRFKIYTTSPNLSGQPPSNPASLAELRRSRGPGGAGELCRLG